jgi:hypothetical protein
MHVVQNCDIDIMEGLAVADPPEPQTHCFLVEGIGGCRFYFLLNLQLKWNVKKQSAHGMCTFNESNVTKIMNLQHIKNKYWPWAHTKSGFDVLGVAKKLAKYVVHSLKRKKVYINF